MGHYIHSFHTALRERPWSFLDISEGYSYGGCFAPAFASKQYVDPSEGCGLAAGGFGLFIFNGWWSGQPASLLQRRLNHCVLAFGVAGAVYMVYKNFFAQRRLGELIAGKEIIPYAAKAFAIANIAQILIGANEKPHRAVAAGISGFITFLEVTKKLPQSAVQVWSLVPIVFDCITIYEGEFLQKILACKSIYERVNIHMNPPPPSKKPKPSKNEIEPS